MRISLFSRGAWQAAETHNSFRLPGVLLVASHLILLLQVQVYRTHLRLIVTNEDGCNVNDFAYFISAIEGICSFTQ